uniref:Uncharacterized protein n=1 Tax=Poecilia latipinna TaxID=48699 RepID=A0A3B3V637_9TELE
PAPLKRNPFQPNIFNKSKCQNCFKSREVHPLNDSDLEQVGSAAVPVIRMFSFY